MPTIVADHLPATQVRPLKVGSGPGQVAVRLRDIGIRHRPAHRPDPLADDQDLPHPAAAVLRDGCVG
ncbi:hypothetical protein [Nonomuraea sp. NPDC005650]|uniref:hypothetical protein n=1 Tax=Nonomuraea sp. NPDC005650 TaxID=3157045 RepID=UPI0033BC2F8B